MIAIMSHPLSALFVGAASRTLAPSDPLFHTGDPVAQMVLVDSGSALLLRATEAGAPLILQRAQPGQVLAEASAYTPTYHCDSLAGPAGATVLAVPRAQFVATLAGDPALAERWAAHLARSVQTARFRTEVRSLRRAEDRLALWLAEGNALPPRGAWADLAAELGLTREALYRALARRRQALPHARPAPISGATLHGGPR
jgi:CRP/FNR family transcriptional regulator, dissimilatory nitrate respiration regulator